MKAQDFDLPRSAIERLIDEWIFNAEHRQIMKERLLDGVCFEPLAEKHHLSVQRVKAIVYQGERQLFKHLQ